MDTMDQKINDLSLHTNVPETVLKNYLTETYVLHDVIHGLITLPKCIDVIIKHKLFQALKDKRQLGPVIFKYPHANHTRFDHCIGVAHLAYLAGRHFKKLYPGTITDKTVLCLTIAGLCHDIGHGAFSHSYDHILHDMLFNSPGKSHEYRSQKLVGYILEELKNEIPIEKADIRLIQYFIDPGKYKKFICTHNTTNSITEHPRDIADYHKGLEQIINNEFNKVDIDKFDYLIRDTVYLRYNDALQNKPDLKKIIEGSLIIDGNWVFNISDQFGINDLICRRYMFYSNSYLHEDIIAIDCMVTDAIKEANEYLQFMSCSALETVEQINQFCQLTDVYIVELILNSNNQRLEKSKKLLMNVCNGKNLYRPVSELLVASDDAIPNSHDVPFNILADKSNPTTSLPKVIYHYKNKIVRQGKIEFVKRLLYQPDY